MIVGSVESVLETKSLWLVLIAINIAIECLSGGYILQLLVYHLTLIYKGVTTRNSQKINSVK